MKPIQIKQRDAWILHFVGKLPKSVIIGIAKPKLREYRSSLSTEWKRDLFDVLIGVLPVNKTSRFVKNKYYRLVQDLTK